MAGFDFGDPCGKVVVADDCRTEQHAGVRIATIFSALAIVVIVNLVLQILCVGGAEFFVTTGGTAFYLPVFERVTGLNPHAIGTTWNQINLTRDTWQPERVNHILGAQL